MMRQSPKPCNQVQGEANPNLVPGEPKYALPVPASPAFRHAGT